MKPSHGLSNDTGPTGLRYEIQVKKVDNSHHQFRVAYFMLKYGSAGFGPTSYGPRFGNNIYSCSAPKCDDCSDGEFSIPLGEVLNGIDIAYDMSGSIVGMDLLWGYDSSKTIVSELSS